MNKAPFPLIWDNSMRSSFVSCPRRFSWEYLNHWKNPEPSIHLHAGAAWATGLESARKSFYELERSPEESFQTGLEAMCAAYGDFEAPTYGSGASKSLDRLIEAFTYYFAAFPLDKDPVQPYRSKDGKPMVEFSFVTPLDDSLRHPETDEPILYSGRADMIATYAGAVSVYDDKTTAQLGASWGDQWQRRAQFTGYCWAARGFNIPVSQVIVRGISIQKTQIKHAEAICIRTPKQIDEWHGQIVRDIKRAIQAWKEGYWDVNLSDACSSYGTCQFIHPCMANDPHPWLETNFVKRIWNPVTRMEDENV